MKSITIVRTLTTAALTALVLAIAPGAKANDRGCSEADLKGKFAYTSTGFIVADAPPALVGPLAEVGTIDFDGKGGVKFTFNSSTNGAVGPGSATGTYEVKDDCTGTFTETSDGFTAHFSFVLDKDGDEFQAICQDPGVVVTRIGRRQCLRNDWRR